MTQDLVFNKALVSKPQEVLGTTNKTYRFIVSTDAPDRDGDIIKQDGWDLTDFNNNPVALLQHKQDQPVGKWSNFQTRQKANGTGFESVADLTLAPPVSDILKYANALVEAGILNSTSVGFRTSAAHAEQRKDAKTGRPIKGKLIKKAKLHEISLVSVPANQEAIRVVKSMGMSEDYQKQFFSEAVESVDEADEQTSLQSQLQAAAVILKGYKRSDSAYKSVFYTQSLEGKISSIIDPTLKALLVKSAALSVK